MAKLIVNKHYDKHSDAKNGFSNVENHEDYAFGEIVICNDKDNPSIYIKDIDNNSVGIGNVRIVDNDSFLSKTAEGKLQTSIKMIWDEDKEEIQLFGINENEPIYRIPITGDNSIETKIERVLDVDIFDTNEIVEELPDGTEKGKTYLKISNRVNGVETTKYFQVVQENEELKITSPNEGAEGEIVVDSEDDIVISHGKVSVNKETVSDSKFNETSFISEIGINELGHVISVKQGTLPSLPSHELQTQSVSPNVDTYYVSDVQPTKDSHLGYEVTYKELPTYNLNVNKNGSNNVNSFVSDFTFTTDDNGNTLTLTKTEVNFNDYLLTKDAEKYIDGDELDTILGNMGLLPPDGEKFEVALTTEERTGENDNKFITDMWIDENNKTKIHFTTTTFDTKSVITKSEVTSKNSLLSWDKDVEIATIGEKTINVKLPSKPGVKIIESEDTSDDKKIIVSISTENNGESDEILVKTKEVNFLTNKSVTNKDATLAWGTENTIATVGDTNINVIMPSQPTISVVDGENEDGNLVVTNIKANGTELEVTYKDFPKDYVTETILSQKNYLTHEKVTIGEGSEEIEKNVKFIKSLSINKADNGNTEITPVYANIDSVTSKQLSDAIAAIDIPAVPVTGVTVNDESVVGENGIAKITVPTDYITEEDLNKAIAGIEIPTPEIPDIPEVIVTDVKYNNITLLDENNVAHIDEVLKDFVKKDDVPDVIVTDVTVNDESVVGENGIAKITVPTNYVSNIETSQTILNTDSYVKLATITFANGNTKDIEAKLPANLAPGGNTSIVKEYRLTGDTSTDKKIIQLFDEGNSECGNIEIDLTNYVKTNEIDSLVNVPVTGVTVNNVSVVENGIAKITVPTDYVTDNDLTKAIAAIDIPEVPVTGVTVNNVSVVENGVAKITVPTDVVTDNELKEAIKDFVTITDIPEVPVTGVTVNGKSVIEDGIAKITVPTDVVDSKQLSDAIAAIDIPEVPVTGVTVNNVSVLEDGIAKINLNGYVTDNELKDAIKDFVTTKDIPEVPVTGVTVNNVSVVENGIAKITVPTDYVTDGELKDAIKDFVTTKDIPKVPVTGVTVNDKSVVDENGIAKITVPTDVVDSKQLSDAIAAIDIPEVPVTGVTVNNVSVLEDGIAKINLNGYVTDGELGEAIKDLAKKSELPVTGVTVNDKSVVDENGIAKITVPTALTHLTGIDDLVKTGTTDNLNKRITVLEDFYTITKDTDTTINQWNDVVDFLKDISDENTLEGILKGKANSTHTHTTSDITDFPTSLPANGGAADSATNDGNGNNIANTYATINWVNSNFNYSTDTNYYLTSVTGDGNGQVTFARQGLNNLTWDAHHTHSEYLTGYTDTKVTSVDNHYPPSSSTTKSAEGGTEVDITNNATSVITGINMDAAGHVVSVNSTALKSTDTNTWPSLSDLGGQASISDLDAIRSNASSGATAHGWGNHAEAGYAKTDDLSGYLPTSGGTIDGDLTVTGDIIVNGMVSGATAYYETSDERLKTFGNDIELNFDKLKSIPKKYFTWKDGRKEGMDLGTSAQIVKEIYPEIVSGDDILSVDYAKLSVVALKAIDKLHEENEMLRAELAMIKKHLGL